jgi:DNA-binding MarR family transcriptional regulator
LSTICFGKYVVAVTSPDELARTHAVVQSFLALSERMRRHFTARTAEFELTPPQGHLLHELAPGPRPMGELAGRLSCDASNVTGLTDRLEARGLVERRPSPGDRRVKVLALTDEGQRVQRALWERLMTDSPVITGLSPEQQATLLATLQQLAGDPAGGGPPRGDC